MECLIEYKIYDVRVNEDACQAILCTWPAALIPITDRPRITSDN